MELLLIKLIGAVVSIVGTFLLGTCIICITPYLFFLIPWAVLPEGFWKNMAWKGVQATWKVQLWLIKLPYTIVMIGQEKKK